MRYIFGSIFYVIGIMLMVFVAPQKVDIGYRHETMMNIPTMFYATWSFILGTMFFIMGYINGLLKKPTSSTETPSAIDSDNVTAAVIAAVVFIVMLCGLAALASGH